MKRKSKHTANKCPKHLTEQYRDGLRQKILDSELPLEAIIKDSYMTVIGQNELWIENYKSLLTFKEELILVQCGNYVLQIEGQGLIISHYMEEHMMIRGKIRSITFV